MSFPLSLRALFILYIPGVMVARRPLHQRLMRSAFRDRTALQHNDLVRIAHSGDPVRNDDAGRHIRSDCFQVALDLLFLSPYQSAEVASSRISTGACFRESPAQC